GIKQDITARRMAGMVFEPCAELEIAERDPDRLAAPARMDDLIAERQEALEDAAGLWRILQFEAGGEGEGANGDAQIFQDQFAFSSRDFWRFQSRSFSVSR